MTVQNYVGDRVSIERCRAGRRAHDQKKRTDIFEPEVTIKKGDTLVFLNDDFIITM